MTTGQPLVAVAPELESIARGPGSGDTFPLLDVADLERLPPPDWLLEEFIPAGGLAVLFGPSGIGKSFLAKDWSLCIAEGLAWYGKPAKSGWVLYIAAEGRAGLGVRVRAWMNARRRSTVERIRFLPEAVNFLDRSQLDRAARTLKLLSEPPALIAIDTMARTMIGGDENAARDVGLFIAAVDELCAGSNAARLIVHHTGKNGEDERGSSALRGAADVMHALRPDGGGLRLECVKSKDAEPYNPWRLRLEPTDESCVIACGTDPDRLAPSELVLLRSVSESFGTGPASTTAIHEASGVPKSSFYRSLRSLTERRFLDEHAAGKTRRYSLSENGAAQLVPASPSESHESGATSPSPHPTLKGWDLGRDRDKDSS